MMEPLADLILVAYYVIQEIQEASREAGVQSNKIGDKAFNSKQDHLTGSECNGPHLSISFLMCHLFIVIQLIPDETIPISSLNRYILVYLFS
jgi:hypothetical protein